MLPFLTLNFSKQSKVKALYSVFRTKLWVKCWNIQILTFFFVALSWLLSTLFTTMFWRINADFKSQNLVEHDLKPRPVIKSGHYILPSHLYRLNRNVYFGKCDVKQYTLNEMCSILYIYSTNKDAYQIGVVPNHW